MLYHGRYDLIEKGRKLKIIIKITILNFTSSDVGHKEIYFCFLSPANLKNDQHVKFLFHFFTFNKVKFSPWRHKLFFSYIIRKNSISCKQIFKLNRTVFVSSTGWLPRRLRRDYTLGQRWALPAIFYLRFVLAHEIQWRFVLFRRLLFNVDQTDLLLTS